MGLPYAQDAGISRHLAAFLCRQHDAAKELYDELDSDGSFIKPTAIIFNGGVLKAPILAERMLSTINSWLSAAGAEPAKLLEGADLDLAVAKGASYYGQVRRGKGVRIRGGIASAYYVGIESAMPAIPGMAPPTAGIVCSALRYGRRHGGRCTQPGIWPGGGRARALPLFWLDHPARRRRGDTARLLGA